MQRSCDGVIERIQRCYQTFALGVPEHLIARIGVAGTIVIAFVRAAHNPGDGLSTVGFWLLLFLAASTNLRDDVPAGR